MPQAIRTWCAAHGVPRPGGTMLALMRLIFDSLAAKIRRGARENCGRLAPFEIECLHVIGGAHRKRLTEPDDGRAVGIPVWRALPKPRRWATSWCQARAAGLVSSLAENRRRYNRTRSIETKTIINRKK